MSNMTPKEAFRAAYALHLAKQHALNPGVYSWPVEHLPEIVNRMVSALEKKSGNIDSPAIKAACKMVMIKPGVARIAEFLKCETWEQALIVQSS